MARMLGRRGFDNGSLAIGRLACVGVAQSAHTPVGRFSFTRSARLIAERNRRSHIDSGR
jgi:hypothetical protein